MKSNKKKIISLANEYSKIQRGLELTMRQREIIVTAIDRGLVGGIAEELYNFVSHHKSNMWLEDVDRVARLLVDKSKLYIRKVEICRQNI